MGAYAGNGEALGVGVRPVDQVPAEAQHDDGGHDLDAPEGNDPSWRTDHHVRESRARGRLDGGHRLLRWLMEVWLLSLLVLLLHGKCIRDPTVVEFSLPSPSSLYIDGRLKLTGKIRGTRRQTREKNESKPARPQPSRHGAFCSNPEPPSSVSIIDSDILPTPHWTNPIPAQPDQHS